VIDAQNMVLGGLGADQRSALLASGVPAVSKPVSWLSDLTNFYIARRGGAATLPPQPPSPFAQQSTPASAGFTAQVSPTPATTVPVVAATGV
jgi:hypothetical protein